MFHKMQLLLSYTANLSTSSEGVLPDTQHWGMIVIEVAEKSIAAIAEAFSHLTYGLCGTRCKYHSVLLWCSAKETQNSGINI